MQLILIITILLYMLSAAGYLAYLFLQKDYLQRFSFCMLTGCLLCHSTALIIETISIGHIPVRNLRETLFIAGWAVTLVFIVIQLKFKLRVLGIYAAPLASLIMVIAAQLPVEPVKTQNVLNSLWLFSHIITIFIGEAALAMACGVGCLYLIQERAIKTKSHRFFFKRLPSLDLLDSTGYVCIVVGFTMLSLGLMIGFVYAKSVWGRFWSWDPKEVWSGITWIFYGILLHGRLTLGWRGRKSAIMAIIGFVVILFTFLGVNFLLKGHHGVFTKW